MYCLVYDFTENSYRPIFEYLWPLLPFLIVGVPVALFGAGKTRSLGFFVAIFSAGLMVVVGYHLFSDFDRIQTTYKQGKYSENEGVVTNFQPSVDEQPELFMVNDIQYKIYPYRMSVTYVQVSHQGGPIREGLRVRIWDIEGAIVRLEVECDTVE